MRMNGHGVIGIGAATGAAISWAIGLALLQPWTEPTGPQAYAENNTYWVRDLRVTAIIAAVLGLLVALDGARPAVTRVAVLGGLWLAADLALDRADISGPVPAVILALVASAVVTATALLLARRPNHAGPPARRSALVVVGAVAAALTPWAAGVESPTDTEPALNPAAVVLGLLLVATCAGAAQGAARAAGQGAARAGFAVRRAAPGLLAVVGGAGVLLLRGIDPYHRSGPMMLLGMLLLAGVVLLASYRSGGWSRLAALGVALLAYPVLMMVIAVLLTFTVPVGAWLTALAGSVPVNAADSDTLYALVGLITGLMLGPLVAAVAAGRHPAPAAANS
ncbi:hypothetical protein [Micromonospora sp. HM5-17]|jgi:hypothetical protein|uniref:hypothetical protein n=1 Tax=Micromonospora sp. HM5-17 TaxID=2487710 RepID=UPI000F464A1C|nr:hypothetical protein [Micromonospora sp. HM5-17]ROT33906.1 hypothetical protein EF879_03140 [Micromonospora sp. HM5-17]